MSPVCILCTTDSDDVLLGRLITKEDLSVHENCLYSSSGLVQEYAPKSRKPDHILGFTLLAIKMEVKRSQKLKCFFCRRVYASVGCCLKKCQKSFHLPCIKKSQGITIFKGTFNSFCFNHKNEQNLDRFYQSCPEMPECCICLSEIFETSLPPTNRLIDIKPEWLRLAIASELQNCRSIQMATKRITHQVIHGECCMKSWMHRECIDKYAASAALHHLKCPMCACRDQFIEIVSSMGVWIPDRDAAWELENTQNDNASTRSNEQNNSTVLTIDTNNRDMSLNISIADSNEVTICPENEATRQNLEISQVNNNIPTNSVNNITQVPVAPEVPRKRKSVRRKTNFTSRKRKESRLKRSASVAEMKPDVPPPSIEPTPNVASNALQEIKPPRPSGCRMNLRQRPSAKPTTSHSLRSTNSRNPARLMDDYDKSSCNNSFLDQSEYITIESTLSSIVQDNIDLDTISNHEIEKPVLKPKYLNTAASKSRMTNLNMMMDTTDLESLGSENSLYHNNSPPKNHPVEIIDLDEDFGSDSNTMDNTTRMTSQSGYDDHVNNQRFGMV